MGIDAELRRLAGELGADFYGVADLTPVRGVVVEQGGEMLAEYDRAIAVGIRMVDEIVDLLPGHRDELAVATGYLRHCYDVINNRLDEMTSRLAGVLQREGMKAMPITAAERHDDVGIRAVFSNKIAARLAGLGWVGKSCLLVTPAVGPRVRWASVLTVAPLQPTGSPLEEACGSCAECVEICPTGAFTGRAFREEEPREARYDARACETYLKRIREETGWGVCGLCVAACPHGRRAT